MNPRIIAWVVGIIVFLVVIGGVGYKIVAPTTKTIVGQGGKVVNITTDAPRIPLGGCSAWRVNLKAYWEKGFKVDDTKPNNIPVNR